MAISKTFNISIDYLPNDDAVMEEKEKTEEMTIVHAPSGKIAITTYDKGNVVVCHSVRMYPILWPGKDDPKCLLMGIDKVTFWGEHTVIWGWYASKDDCKKEIQAIAEALRCGEGAYDLKYHAAVDMNFWGAPKIKKN